MEKSMPGRVNQPLSRKASMERRNYNVTISDARNHVASAQVCALNQAEALCIAAGYAFREIQAFKELVESECWIVTSKPAQPTQTRSG